MPRHPIQTELVNIRLSGASQPPTAFIDRIDEDHANPRKLWQKMREPEYLSPLQVSQLEAASVLARDAQPLLCQDGHIDLKVDLPPQSVASITLEFA